MSQFPIYMPGGMRKGGLLPENKLGGGQNGMVMRAGQWYDEATGKPVSGAEYQRRMLAADPNSGDYERNSANAAAGADAAAGLNRARTDLTRMAADVLREEAAGGMRFDAAGSSGGGATREIVGRERRPATGVAGSDQRGRGSDQSGGASSGRRPVGGAFDFGDGGGPVNLPPRVGGGGGMEAARSAMPGRASFTPPPLPFDVRGLGGPSAAPPPPAFEGLRGGPPPMPAGGALSPFEPPPLPGRGGPMQGRPSGFGQPTDWRTTGGSAPVDQRPGVQEFNPRPQRRGVRPIPMAGSGNLMNAGAPPRSSGEGIQFSRPRWYR